MFAEGLNVTPPTPSCHLRRMSEVSIQSTVSGVIDSLPLQTINACKHFNHKRMFVCNVILTNKILYQVKRKLLDSDQFHICLHYSSSKYYEGIKVGLLLLLQISDLIWVLPFHSHLSFFLFRLVRCQTEFIICRNNVLAQSHCKSDHPTMYRIKRRELKMALIVCLVLK
jgi:hypothetical protein